LRQSARQERRQISETRNEQMSLRELCKSGYGTEASSSTSWDPMHSPSAIIDGKSGTYWISTGLFPQEVTIALPELSSIKKIEIVSQGIKQMEVLKCETLNTASWERICLQREVDDADGELQRLSPSITSDTRASHVRIKILTGWTDIVSIFKVSINGSTVNSSNSSDNKAGSAHSTAGSSLGSRLAASGDSSPKYRK
jgi:hypothetical protein